MYEFMMIGRVAIVPLNLSIFVWTRFCPISKIQPLIIFQICAKLTLLRIAGIPNEFVLGMESLSLKEFAKVE